MNEEDVEKGKENSSGEEILDDMDFSNFYVEGEGILYTTGDVAKMTGVSRDMVRYYIKEFSEYIHGERTDGGHIRLHANDVEMIKTIIRLSKTKKSAEIKGILQNPDMLFLYGGKSETEQIIANMLLKNNKHLLSSIQKVLSEYIQQANSQRDRIYLEQHEQDEQEKLELRQKIEELEKTVQVQNDMMQKQEEMLQKILEQTEKKKPFWKR